MREIMIQYKRKPVPFDDLLGLPEQVQACQMSEPLDTPDGQQTGKAGDYLVNSRPGKFYVVDRKVFEKTYERSGIPIQSDSVS